MDLKQLAIFVGFCTAFGTIAAVLSTTSAEYTTGSWRPVNNDPDEPESIFEDEIFFMFSALLFYCFVLAPYGVYSYQLSATSGKSAVEHIQHVGRTRAALDGFHFPAKLLNSQGLVLHTRQWLPQKKPLGIAFLVHGYGEHVGRYEHVASTLTAAGLAVFGLDHQGKAYVRIDNKGCVYVCVCVCVSLSLSLARARARSLSLSPSCSLSLYFVRTFYSLNQHELDDTVVS